jgi:pilus assembly protein Flp/PilA
MLELIRNFAKCQKGATAVEYGLIVSLLVIVMLAALGNVADTTTGIWNSISNEIVLATK